MRKWACVAIVLATFVYAGAAKADTPPEIYSDFAEDGVLDCGHSRSALKKTLNDAAIHQYGDPLTFIGLKLAIRKQLAGSCSRKEQKTPAFVGSKGGPRATTPPPPSEPGTKKPSGGKPKTEPGPTSQRSFDEQPSVPEAEEVSGVPQDGRMVLLGVVLLLVTLGSGGWAARRAFTD